MRPLLHLDRSVLFGRNLHHLRPRNHPASARTTTSSSRSQPSNSAPAASARRTRSSASPSRGVAFHRSSKATPASGDRDVLGIPRGRSEVLCDFAAWSDDATLIAHNAKRFDSKFLAGHLSAPPNFPAVRSTRLIRSQSRKMLFGKTRGTGHSLDHVKSRLSLQETTLRRHDARGDVDILGRAVQAMHQRLELDNAFNGVPRHTTPPAHRLSGRDPRPRKRFWVLILLPELLLRHHQIPLPPRRVEGNDRPL